MTGRDRIVGAGVAAIVVLGGVWMEVVSPERSKVSTAASKVESAHSQLESARSELTKAKYAQEKYSEAYSSVVRLGRAVPADQEIPGLIYELDQASDHRNVEFASIAPSTTGTGAQTPKAAKEKEASTGFQAMPFTFTFNGSFADLYHLMTTLQGYATTTSTGELKVAGRLLTIQGFKLAPSTSAPSTVPKVHNAVSTSAPGEHLNGTVTATAYVLPPGSEPTGGGSSSGPSGSGSSHATPASSGGSSSSAAPATIKAAP